MFPSEAWPTLLLKALLFCAVFAVWATARDDK